MSEETANSEPRQCCASCACWLPEIMECKYAPGQAAPPEAGCDGWIKGKASHWLNRTNPQLRTMELCKAAAHQALMANANAAAILRITAPKTARWQNALKKCSAAANALRAVS